MNKDPKEPDKFYADRIRSAVDILNKAIVDAADYDIELERLKQIEVTEIKHKFSVYIYTPVIVKKDIL